MTIAIKVCGMTDPENVRKVAGLKPDYLGVILVASSPRYISDLECIRKIHASCGDSKLVAVVKSPHTELLSEICAMETFSAVQIHGDQFKENAEYIRTHSRGLQVWQALSLDDDFRIEEVVDNNISDRVIFDGKSPGGGVPFNWSTLASRKISLPFFIAGGIGPENCRAVLEIFNSHKNFVGLDINSRVESSPGVKDIKLVKQVMAEVGRVV